MTYNARRPDDRPLDRTAPAGLPSLGRKMSVIFNPTAGGEKRRALRVVLHRLETLGCRVALHETQEKGHASLLAASFGEDVDIVVAAGGDGTINEVVAGLARRGSERRLPLGIVPLGTANVLAQEMGIGSDLDRAAMTLAKGTPRPVWYATADDRPFLLMAGVGFDAHVVANVKAGLKRHTGKLAYVWETLSQALRYDFPTVRLRIDGEMFEAATAVICNGRCYGGALVAVPDGDLGRPDLRVVLLTRKGYRNVFRYGAALALGRLPRLADVEIVPAQAVEILDPRGAPLQADGDGFGNAPSVIRAGVGTIDLVWPC